MNFANAIPPKMNRHKTTNMMKLNAVAVAHAANGDRQLAGKLLRRSQPLIRPPYVAALGQI
jgi:hypothetical protein